MSAPHWEHCWRTDRLSSPILLGVATARVSGVVVDPNPVVLKGAAGAIHVVAVSADGTLCVSVSYDVPGR